MFSQEIIDLANYRLNQAKENLEEAEILYEINKFKEDCKIQIDKAKNIVCSIENYLTNQK